MSRFLAGLLVAGCVTAAAAGAYMAVRQNASPQPAPVSPASAAAAPALPSGPATPVSETEAVVGGASALTPEKPAPTRSAAPDPVRAEEPKPAAAVTRSEPRRDSGAARRPPAEAARTRTPAAVSQSPAAVPLPAERVSPETAAVAANDPAPEPVRVPEPAHTPQRQFDEVVLPASSVVGLQVDTPLSSERTRLEDRVDAHVSRDVIAAGRVAIPAGSRVIGSVTLVERGGKMKERARLGVRFHTLVLADGRDIPLRTEAILREGDSPSNESARKIGGAAIGGAILGAILGGGKGAVVGGAAGAAGGSAAVMAGDRNAATLPAGTIVTVRLTAPATIEVEREQ